MAEELVVVSWWDAFFDYEGDRSPSEPLLVRTTGWLLRESPVVTVASEHLGSDGYRAVTHIPKDCVEDITRLRTFGATIEGGLAGIAGEHPWP